MGSTVLVAVSYATAIGGVGTDVVTSIIADGNPITHYLNSFRNMNYSNFFSGLFGD
jgi:hypothetical protein